MGRRLMAAMAVACAVLLCGEAVGGIRARVTGYVEAVELSDPAAPVATLRLIDPPGGIADRVVLAVPFKPSPDGCIDWSDPDNRAHAFVLGLKPGNVVRTSLPPGAGKKGDAPIVVGHLFFVAASSDTVFPGREKITDPGLVSAFQPEPVRIPVIVTLATGKDLVAKPADPDASRAAAAALKQIRVRLRTDLPEDDFEVADVLENAPVIMGTVNLAGLKALAAHPLVAAIEPDRSMTLQEVEAGAFETAPGDDDAETVQPDTKTEGTWR